MEIDNSIKSLAAAALLLAAGVPAMAQDNSLRGSVVVDGKYLPDVIRQDRINTLPRIYSFPLDATALSYEQRGVTTPFAPSFTALPNRGWQTTRTVRDYKGYLDIQAGSWLNSSISAGYRILNTECDILGVWLQHNSSSLFKPDMSEYTADVRKKNYDEVIGAYYAHTFADAGRFDARLDYRLGYFNYYGYYAPLEQQHPGFDAPTQTVNDIAARIGWRSLPDNPFQYDAALKVRYFGYRSLYLPQRVEGAEADMYTLSSMQGQRETHTMLEGGISYDFDSSSTLGIRLNGDVLGYDSPVWSQIASDGYGDIRLAPFYRFQRGNLNINLGAKLDFTFGAGPELDRYSAFHIAPDVRLDYKAGIAGLYLHVGGGTHLNTLAAQGTGDYYGLPGLLTTSPVHSPLDGKLGVNFGPFAGVTAGVSFAYKYLRHQPFAGLYTMYMNNPAAIAEPGVCYMPLYPDGMDVKGWGIQAYMNYDLSDVVNIGVEGSYQPQDGSTGYYNGIDRPRWLLTASASVAPVKPLRIVVEYNYRGVRNIYCPTQMQQNDPNVIIGGEGAETGVRAMRLPDITNLSARVSYAVSPALTLSVQADNVLNRHNMLLPDVKSQGISVLGGLSVTF